ncbi:Allantoinase [uncultured Clostridium sp.]|nr:Allantoinase [uncultured Clostridium sp.]
MLDLVVKNGKVYVDGSFRECDVGIKDGKFVLVGMSGTLPEAQRTIDATGKYVIPGGIDTHVHYRDPGHWERETFEVGSRAAAAGGCTTFFEHPISMPPQWKAEILQNRLDICTGKDSPANDRHEKGVCVDFCFYGAAGGQHPEAIEPLSHAGIVAYKTFLHDAPEGREQEFEGLTSANNDQLYRVLQEVKKTGLPLAAHAEDNELVTGFIKRLREEGRQGENIAHCLSRPPIVEIEAISKMLKFAKDVGCPIELVHVSSWEAMELAKQAKAEGQKVFVETCPHYLLLDESYVEKFGAYAKCNPALRKKEEVEKLWDYVLDGTVDFIGSDHSPYLVSEKDKLDKNGNKDIFLSPAGFPGIDLRLPLMLTEAKKGRVSMERVVELLCVNPAKCFNIYPQKGTISAGADADLVIVDMGHEHTFQAKDSYSQARDTMKVFEGCRLGCSVDYTVVRGRVVVENGVVDESAAGWGQMVTPNKKG